MPTATVVTSLEEELVRAGLVSAEQAAHARRMAEETTEPFAQVLLNLGYVEEEPILKTLGALLRVPYVLLENKSPEPSVVMILPEEFCLARRVIALEHHGEALTVAAEDPHDLSLVDEIQNSTKLTAKFVVASRGAILRKLADYHDHYKAEMVERLLSSVTDQGITLTRRMGIDIDILSVQQVAAEESPIIRAVNLIILRALQRRASDIHLEPSKKFLHVRYRIDGVLHEQQVFPIAMAPGIVSRVKIMATLDIAERRMPQDGHFHLSIEGREIDFRVATTPTMTGEKVVIRILDKGSVVLDLNHLGFTGEVLTPLRHFIHKPYGIVVITGPTGSGKTTTLYAALMTLNAKELNITTVEDPVEYQMEGITQIQVNDEIELSFPRVLRSVLRQDPDVILVGEIRDLETTEIAIRASLTGHLVLATLHTNDSASALARLADMGAEPYLVASSLRCAVAQRLVRTICPKCRVAYEPDPGTFDATGIPASFRPKMLFRGEGCAHCFGTGFRGRIVVSELLPINEEMRRMILQRAPSHEIKRRAAETGMYTMREDGLEKVATGVTTLEEVLAATDEE